VMGVNSKKKQQ